MAVGELNKQIVNETFNCAYSEEQFRKFILELLPSADFTREIKRIDPNTQGNQFADFIRSAKRICKYKYTYDEFGNEKVIDVLVVKLKRTSSVERARTAQRNFVARYLNLGRNYQKDAALVAFISEDEQGNISPDWRFSLVQMNYKAEIIEDENGKKKRVITTELTPAKRFSFLVGENEDTHTAQQQFGACLEKSANGEKITIEDLVAAFDIEKVSKEFFEKYKNLYLKMRDELKRLCEVDEIVRKYFIEHNINIDDFAKKTMGQLVFLYFIQKKGWLGVSEDKDWGSGDKKFLSNIFKGQYCKYNNFFNDILEHLFYEALAKDRTDKKDVFGILNCRIPFLNGGLFEPVNGYEWTKTDLTIDNNIFKEIFETFDLYNFTVKEDEPLEKEVAIDPEMLGKVFENLLPENIRKGNGAFYTPREIVHYMCQESLINYLYNKVNIKEVELSPEAKVEQQKLFKAQKIGQLKLTQEVLDEIIPKDDIEFFIKTGSSTYVNKSRKLNVTLPDTITNNAQILDKALFDIKVCDPAIGSGAFPVGMMNEIVRARAALSESIGLKDRSMYELKRNAIENSIYGVDIDAGAVDIAKLRFWLSLVVDEEDIKNIKPLPNLDYKIMQGNSLITSYEGIDFDEIVANQPKNKQLDLFSSASEKITDKISHQINQITNNYNETQKKEIKQKIENLIVELVKTKFEEKAELEGKSKDYYEEKIRNFAQNKENRNFFPWKLFFADAFENGGFDVVIGNPPYASLENIDNPYKADLNIYNCYAGKADLLYFFYEKGQKLLSNKGVLTFITSRYFLEATYAKKLRNYLKSNAKILSIIDFGQIKIFDTADIHTCIFTLSNNKSLDVDLQIIKFNAIPLNIKQECENKSSNECKFYINIKQDDLNEEGWAFSDDKTTNLRNKIFMGNKTLKDISTIEQGQKSGLNDVFNVGIDEINQYKLEKEPLKKCIKNSHINPYYVDYRNRYLIYTNDDFNIDEFPHIKAYLLKYKNELYARAEAKDDKYAWYRLQRPREKELFDKKEKIVVPYRATKNKFAYDNCQYYNDGGDIRIIVINDDKYNVKYVISILNSKLMNFYYSFIGRKKGNMYEYFVEPLYRIPIKYTEKQLQYIQTVDKILELTNSDDYSNNTEKQQAVKEYENQIDIMVYKLYNLTYQEVLTIDKDFSMSEQEYNNYQI